MYFLVNFQAYELGLTLLVLTFLVHSGIGVGHNVPTDIETPVKPQVFVQIKSNKSRKVE